MWYYIRYSMNTYPTTSSVAWVTGECPYKLQCDNSNHCPAETTRVNDDEAEKLRAEGFDVASFAYDAIPITSNHEIPASAHNEVEICMQALQQPEIVAKMKTILSYKAKS